MTRIQTVHGEGLSMLETGAIRVPLQPMDGDLIANDPLWLVGPADYDNEESALIGRVEALQCFQSNTDERMRIAYSYWMGNVVSSEDQLRCNQEIQIIRIHLWETLQIDQGQSVEEQRKCCLCCSIVLGVAILATLVAMIVLGVKK